MLLKHLNKGDTIGIVSPASPIEKDVVLKNIQILKDLGFNIKLGTHIYDKCGYLSGKDIDRAKDLMDMFIDPSIDMILCSRGGYGSMRILPYLDFNIIKNNPKIFGGFSDITILLNYITSKCDFTTFHCPMLSSDFNNMYTLKSFLKPLMNDFPSYEISNPNFVPLLSKTNDIAEGELVGGNLSLICSTLGTPYEIDTVDSILFLEEISEPPYKIDRMLTQLILSGKIKSCSGLILGQFSNCNINNRGEGFSLDEVILDRLLPSNKPIIANLMSGHCDPNLTLPIGSKVRLDCKNKLIRVLNY
ncbi:LD-carboxypeptidase [Clostridium sporogenes]|uniref:S66 peptidase family protein n=1 Tax=Clostridium sporogenes TaxID=1509 RepID=UPI002149D542|nr:LD-carboxypeptidase [Clostridium sporogenes]MCR1975736.1 LD-carboxypeptidase [Clostridium sporogenes]